MKSKKINLLVIVLIVFACGKKESPEQNIVGNSSIKGSNWHGIFSPAKGQENLGLVEPLEVGINLQADDNFHFQLVKQTSSEVKGTYTDMPKHQYLIFQIQESSFEHFGKKGSIVDLEYNLNEKELVLVAKNGVYKLSNTPSPQENNLAETYVGNWICTDQRKNSWKIDLKTDMFWGEIINQNGANIVFKGKSSLDPNDSKIVILEIEESNFREIIGSTFKLLVKDQSTSELTQINKRGIYTGEQPTECKR